MKHYIISEEQLEWIKTMIGEAKWNFLKLQKLPELKRLGDAEIDSMWQNTDTGDSSMDGRAFAHAIMDKLGVPK